ncbi:MBL fold metallo-hydrolase [Streptomyces longispororuber]|uniref:MBL fold metallo-hydrolase n=1 Tax=Streptomyces longispororuber TaxID=68230 RepID=A0A919DF26_9ACTN|nr:MBL fold metallo-hydrolase [Streptomyces longispororuber]GHE38091.1 MBL fold metallo-hydrolase [Streptomyces longispororuber]
MHHHPTPAQEPHTSPRTLGTTPAWAVGSTPVHRVDEIDFPPETGAWLLPDATPDVVARAPWLTPDFADDGGVLRASSHSFAFTVDGRRVLVDTGIGNGKQRAMPAWHELDTDYLDRLTAAGYAPDSVDLVILTHLHADHVGWNTRLENGTWVPTFPRARYVTTRTEWDHWASVDMEESRRQMFRDSVHPVRDAGLLDVVDITEGPVALAPGLRLLPTPGHTPGQVAVELRDSGDTALITGDAVHHPVQLAHPHLASCADTDSALARATRAALLASAAGSGALLLGTHFAPPTAGRLTRDGSGYRLTPVRPALAQTY